MKHLVFALGALLLAIALPLANAHRGKEMAKTDSYIRERVLLLKSEVGTCTGVQIRTEEGQSYVLTAAHCKALMKSDEIEGVDEEGRIPYS